MGVSCEPDEYEIFGSCKACHTICSEEARKDECRTKCPVFYGDVWESTTAPSVGSSQPTTDATPGPDNLLVIVSLCGLLFLLIVGVVVITVVLLKRRERRQQRHSGSIERTQDDTDNDPEEEPIMANSRTEVTQPPLATAESLEVSLHTDHGSESSASSQNRANNILPLQPLSPIAQPLPTTTQSPTRPTLSPTTATLSPSITPSQASCITTQPPTTTPQPSGSTATSTATQSPTITQSPSIIPSQASSITPKPATKTTQLQATTDGLAAQISTQQPAGCDLSPVQETFSGTQVNSEEPQTPFPVQEDQHDESRQLVTNNSIFKFPTNEESKLLSDENALGEFDDRHGCNQQGDNGPTFEAGSQSSTDVEEETYPKEN